MDRWTDDGCTEGQTDAWKNNVVVTQPYHEGK